MKTLKTVLAFSVVTFALGGLARADQEKTGSKPAACCAKAAEEGKTCAHECCAAAAKNGKACEKCGGSNEKSG